MLLRNVLATARAAHSDSDTDFCLSVSDPRVDKVGGWFTHAEGEAFRRAVRAAGYRSVSDGLRDLVLMKGSVDVLVDLRRQQLAGLDQSCGAAATPQQ